MSQAVKRGTKVSEAEKRRYEMLRKAGFSPAPAAETIGRSPSWAYSYEAKERIIPGYQPGTRKPSRTLEEAVEFVIALGNDDSETCFKLLETFGIELIFHIGKVARFFVVMETSQTNLLHSGDPRLADGPLEPDEILKMVPQVMEAHFAGKDLEANPVEPARLSDQDGKGYAEWLKEERESDPT